MFSVPLYLTFLLLVLGGATCALAYRTVPPMNWPSWLVLGIGCVLIIGVLELFGQERFVTGFRIPPATSPVGFCALVGFDNFGSCFTTRNAPHVPQSNLGALEEMTHELTILCDHCHERPAVRHMHTFHGEGETEAKRHLCAECFERLAPPNVLAKVRRLQDAVRSGKCKYCGAPAVCGSSKKNLLCEQCRRDLKEFSSLPENAIPEDPGEDEAKWEQISKQLKEQGRRRDAFMRQRVEERSRRPPGGL